MFFDDVERSFSFTAAARNTLFEVVDHSGFLEEDAKLILNALLGRLHPVPFGDYLKRCIYLKAGMTEHFDSVPLKTYQEILTDAFREQRTPFSLTPTTAKPSAMTRNWLTQHSIRREAVFLIGFALRLDRNEVDALLVSGLKEAGLDENDPFEALCGYCYDKGYTYGRFRAIWSAFSEERLSGNLSLSGQDRAFLRTLREIEGGKETRLNNAKACFQRLYAECRQVIAASRNAMEQEEASIRAANVRDRLAGNDRLYDFEKLDRVCRVRNAVSLYTADDIGESDVEDALYAAVPKDRHGNLVPVRLSLLSECFEGKRLGRKRLNDLANGKSVPERFDIVTLSFFLFSQRTDRYPKAQARYSAFMEETNLLLNECGMGPIYEAIPYECFLLMCMLSVEPLTTFSDVWEKSFEGENGEE